MEFDTDAPDYQEVPMEDVNDEEEVPHLPINAPESDSVVVNKFGTISDRDKYDLKVWDSILLEAVKNGLEDARKAYIAFFAVYPTAGNYWKAYVSLELENRNYKEAEEIFQLCLVKSLNVELFRTYVDYIQNVKMKKSDLSNSVRTATIISAYEFALGQVGLDITSSLIWMEYIDFLRSDSNPNLEAIRDVYRRALSNPMHNLETLWSKYSDFERWTESQKNIELLQRTYDDARKVYRTRKSYVEGINKSVLPPSRGQLKELHQLKLWKKLFEYEKQNPQMLDNEQLERRMNFTFNQAISCLYHYPEIWHIAAQYQVEVMHIQKAKEVYERAIFALPKSLLLHFQFCDFLELNNMPSDADMIYQNLTLDFPDNPLVWIHYMYFCRRSHGIEGARKVFFKVRKYAHCTHHIYVAAAQIEFYVNKDECVARNILELGYNQFNQNTDFLQHYVDFLFHRNEESYMRVLFEKILSTLATNKSMEMWNLFIKFENLNGNLESVSKLEDRHAKTFPGMDPSGILGIVQRKRFLDLWPCTSNELMSFSTDYRVTGNDKLGDDDDGIDQNTEENEHFKDNPSTADQLANRLNTLVMPDIAQLDVYSRGGSSSTLNVRLTDFIQCLPRTWTGVEIDVHKLIQSIRDNRLEVDPTIFGMTPVRMAESNDHQETFTQLKSREFSDSDIYHRRAKRVARTIPSSE